MRYSFKVPKGVCTIASFSAVVLAAVLAGCDSSSGPDMSNPETKKQVEARAQGIAEEDAKINATLSKKGGKSAPQAKSIKGAIKLPE
jgi:hypothetical protein